MIEIWVIGLSILAGVALLIWTLLPYVQEWQANEVAKQAARQSAPRQSPDWPYPFPQHPRARMWSHSCRICGLPGHGGIGVRCPRCGD